MRNLLFICSRNRLRSPTAEALFSGRAGFGVRSAGTAPDAECPVDAELIDWAQDIYVMEQHHKVKLVARFGKALSGKRLIVLRISDRFQFMDPELIGILEKKFKPALVNAAAGTTN